MEPYIHQFLACMGIECDITRSPPAYTLEDVFTVLRPADGPVERFSFEGMWVFMQLSDAAGSHELALDLIRDEGAEIRTIRTFRIDCGNDRLAVRNWAMRLPVLAFEHGELYTLRLRLGNVELARTDFRVESL